PDISEEKSTNSPYPTVCLRDLLLFLPKDWPSWAAITFVSSSTHPLLDDCLSVELADLPSSLSEPLLNHPRTIEPTCLSKCSPRFPHRCRERWTRSRASYEQVQYL